MKDVTNNIEYGTTVESRLWHEENIRKKEFWGRGHSTRAIAYVNALRSAKMTSWHVIVPQTRAAK